MSLSQHDPKFIRAGLPAASPRRFVWGLVAAATALGLAVVTAIAGVGETLARIPYPKQAIVLIVPAPRGGGTDLFARHLAQLVEADLGQRVIVNNRPREGGMSGIHEMTRAQPDGYTVGFVWNSPLTVTPLTVRAPYEKRDYRAVMSIGFSSYVLCARPDFPADDATALIEHLVANPGLYSYGNDGAGGTMRLAAERIFRSAGAELRGVPFSGATETARNFLAGQVDFYGGSLAAILPHVESGQAKCLILTSADDNPAMPAASGLRALGLEHAETVLWWGMIAPAGVPDDDVARLEAAFLAAAESEPFIADMIRRGAVPRARGAIETDAMIESEIAAFREIVATQ